MHQQNYMVIGGSQGIGLALVKQLLSTNANIYTASRKPAPEFENNNIHYLPFDISSPDMGPLEQFLPEALDGLVYCPGSITLKPFHRLEISEFQKDLEVNLFGAVKAIQTALPALKKAESASIVLFSTVATRAGMNFHASIAAAKAAVEGLALSLAAEFASQNIRVNVIAPSITRTPLAQRLLSTEDKIQASANRHPLKKIGEPAELASLAAYLLSAEAGWITGQIIGVDGGMSALRPL